MTETTTSDFGLLRLPTRIHFGDGAAASIAPLVAELGTRVLVCVDPFLATTPDFQRTVERLEASGALVRVWTDIEPELPVASVERSAEQAADFSPDVILGYGGGSALDLAKLVALLLAHGGTLSSYYGENAVPGPVLPLIAVPTTSGTGSEVTPVAVVSDPNRELKVGVSSPHLIPRCAVVDPLLTHGAPAAVTAHSGIDALVHAVEAFTSAQQEPRWPEPLPVFVGQNVLSRLLAQEAITTITGNLVRAVHTPSDAGARHAMAYGSLLAGMSFGSAGTHLSHAIQYPVGAATKTPHGLGTGLLLPHVLRACLPDIEPQLSTIGTWLGGTGSDEARARHAIHVIDEITTAIGLPGSLAELGITEHQLPLIADRAATISRLARNVAATAPIDRIPAIVAAAWRGDRA